MTPGNTRPERVCLDLQPAHLFDIKLLRRLVTNLARQSDTLTRTNVHNFAHTNVHEHMRSVFPPIEQACTFTFAGHISPRLYPYSPHEWRRYLK